MSGFGGLIETDPLSICVFSVCQIQDTRETGFDRILDGSYTRRLLDLTYVASLVQRDHLRCIKLISNPHR